MSSPEVVDWHGELGLRAVGGDLVAVTLPNRGGKIASLIDRDGREWLEQPELPLTPTDELSPDFVAGDMCGWDECAPTVDACVADGWTMPDHGDVWDRPWSSDDAGWLGVASPTGAYRLRRRVVAQADRLRLDYEATTDLASFPFLWAAHPQFAAPPGTTVRLPAEVTEVIDGEDPALPRLPLDADLTSIDRVPAGGSRKLFVDPDVPVGRAELVRPDGATLLLTWDASVVPYLGVWYDRSEFSRHDVIAVEPMTGWFDVCSDALKRGRVSVLSADRPLRWSVELRVLRRD